MTHLSHEARSVATSLASFFQGPVDDAPIVVLKLGQCGAGQSSVGGNPTQVYDYVGRDRMSLSPAVNYTPQFGECFGVVLLEEIDFSRVLLAHAVRRPVAARVTDRWECLRPSPM